MINQSFLDSRLSRNPSMSELSALADALDNRANERLVDAQRQRLHRGWNVTLAELRCIRDMHDTADAIRAIVYEAAQALAVPDWALTAASIEPAA